MALNTQWFLQRFILLTLRSCSHPQIKLCTVFSVLHDFNSFLYSICWVCSVGCEDQYILCIQDYRDSSSLISPHFLQNPNIVSGQDKDVKLVICIFHFNTKIYRMSIHIFGPIKGVEWWTSFLKDVFNFVLQLAVWNGLIELVDQVLFPSLSLLECNPSIAEEVWILLKAFPYNVRYVHIVVSVLMRSRRNWCCKTVGTQQTHENVFSLYIFIHCKTRQ